MGSPWHIAHNAMRGRDHLKGKSLDRRIVRRVWTFARPYRPARTRTLGTVVSNVMDVAFTLAAMVVLEWRLTLLALVVLPAFFIPSKWVGRRLQKITLESFNLNAAMNSTMTERFNVAGALP